MARINGRASLLAVALVASLFLPVPLALAEDHSDDDAKHKVERKVEDDKLTILVEREKGELEDKLEITLDVPAGTFNLKWEEENATTETEQSLELLLGRLMEYEDTNGNGKFDAGDHEVQAFDLGNGGDGDWSTDAQSINWDPLSVEPVTAQDGTVGQKAMARASLGDGGVFGLDVFLFDAEARLAGQSLQPTTLKFDIIVESFPYAEENTAVAVVLETHSESEFEVDGDDGTIVASASDGPVALAFTWIDEVEVDGSTEEVGTTVLSEELEQKVEDDEVESEQKTVLAFSYPRGTSIVHDPTLGLQDASQRGAPALGLVGVIVALALGATIVGKRRS